MDVDPKLASHDGQELGKAQQQNYKTTNNDRFNKRMKRIKSFTGLTALLCCFASTSQATLLPPGGVVLIGAAEVQAAAGGSVVGSASGVYDSGVAGSTPGLVGTVDSEVRKDDPANPFGLGFFSYYYQIHNNDPTSTKVVSRLTMTGYDEAGAFLDVKVIAVLPGKSPTSADREFAPGDGVGFNFGPGAVNNLPVGASSYIMVLHTKTTNFESALGSIADSGASSSVEKLLVPAAPIPEPTTMIAGAMLLLPFGASTLRVLRKRRVA